MMTPGPQAARRAGSGSVAILRGDPEGTSTANISGPLKKPSWRLSGAQNVYVPPIAFASATACVTGCVVSESVARSIRMAEFDEAPVPGAAYAMKCPSGEMLTDGSPVTTPDGIRNRWTTPDAGAGAVRRPAMNAIPPRTIAPTIASAIAGAVPPPRRLTGDTATPSARL